MGFPCHFHKFLAVLNTRKTSNPLRLPFMCAHSHYQTYVLPTSQPAPTSSRGAYEPSNSSFPSSDHKPRRRGVVGLVNLLTWNCRIQDRMASIGRIGDQENGIIVQCHRSPYLLLSVSPQVEVEVPISLPTSHFLLLLISPGRVDPTWNGNWSSLPLRHAS